MKSRDFCYWLQGFFEISGGSAVILNSEQIQMIQNHLNMVFVHEIDPSFPAQEQGKLNETHRPPPIPEPTPAPSKGMVPPPWDKPMIRC